MTKKSKFETMEDIGPVVHQETEDQGSSEVVEGVVEMINANQSKLCGSCFKTINEDISGKLFMKCSSCSMKQSYFVKYPLNLKTEKRNVLPANRNPEFLQRQLLMKPDEIEDFILSRESIKFNTV